MRGVRAARDAILTASEDGTARVWDVGHDVQPGIDGLLYQLPGQAAPLSSVAVSPTALDRRRRHRWPHSRLG